MLKIRLFSLLIFYERKTDVPHHIQLYPPENEGRILGQEGHLSNRAAADLLEKVDVPPEVVFLAHLSEMNNSPRLAYDTVKSVLEDNPRTRDVTLYVASQKEAVSNFSLK